MMIRYPRLKLQKPPEVRRPENMWPPAMMGLADDQVSAAFKHPTQSKEDTVTHPAIRPLSA